VIFRSRYSIGRVSKSRSRRSVGAQHQAKKNRQQKAMQILKIIGIYAGSACLLGMAILGIIMTVLSRNLPDVEQISSYIPAETTKIYSSDGVILAELHREENRILIPIEKISPILQKTVVAVEDADFYNHHGINFKGILRAFVVNIKAGGFVQGGSTITQQLARNLFLTKKRKLSRKLSEAILAVQIERKYTKTEILEMYLNQVYWGHNAYGIESATKLYFDKNAKDLTLGESAMLVGLLTGPELYSPIRHFTRAKKRQNTVLKVMEGRGIISADEKAAAYNEDLVITKRKKFRFKAPFFTAHVVKQLIDMYGEESVYTSGLKVFTTLQYKLQEHGEEVVKEWVEYGKTPKWVHGEKVPSLNYSEGALLSIDPRTGYIVTMVGGVDFQVNQFNRTTQALRQPGSAFKPFLYLTALEKGFSPGTIIEDAPVTFNTIEGPYSPSNYSQKFLGKIPMRRAFELSVNVVSIKLNYLMGPEHMVKVAKKIGIQSPLKPILSLPLGANEVTMLELTSAYGVFANQGIRVEPTAIVRIEDREGTALYEHKIKEDRVFDKNLIATLVELMRGIVNYGTGKGAKLPRPVAGKTGTTSDYRDAWFVGFVPQLVTTAWVGNDDNSPTMKITGGWVPARMWKDFMIKALSGMPAQNFPRPKGLTQHKINWETGNIATEFSPEESVSIEKFWIGSEPKKSDTINTLFSEKNKKEKDTVDKETILNFFDN
jgi:penicillin-binding protein 1A